VRDRIVLGALALMLISTKGGIEELIESESAPLSLRGRSGG